MTVTFSDGHQPVWWDWPYMHIAVAVAFGLISANALEEFIENRPHAERWFKATSKRLRKAMLEDAE